MVIAIIGAALNVILDFLLVYGIDGVFEGLHIKGAAYASVIAQLIMAVIAGFLLLPVLGEIQVRYKLKG